MEKKKASFGVAALEEKVRRLELKNKGIEHVFKT